MEETGDKQDNQPNVAVAGTSFSEEVPKVSTEASVHNPKQHSRSREPSRQLRRRRSNRLTLLSIDEQHNDSQTPERVHLSVHLQWDIHDPVSSRDWIALYNLGKFTSKYL